MSPTYRSFAKLNLHLQVVGRRTDGYHELRTLFQTVDLYDLLTVELTDTGVELEVEGSEVPTGADNLAHRAATEFLRRWAPGRGVRLQLAKRIPVGGGLGGGSSNAAAVLQALQEQLGHPASLSELWLVARTLGADVPYFLVGGTALGFGRGDEVIPILELPTTELWLAIAPVEISSAAVFASLGDLTAQPLASSIMALARGEVGTEVDPVDTGKNDLQTAVLTQYKEVRDLFNAMLHAGASQVRLSGSGATLFARFPGAPRASDVAAALPRGCRLERVTTLSRVEVAARRNVQ